MRIPQSLESFSYKPVQSPPLVQRSSKPTACRFSNKKYSLEFVFPSGTNLKIWLFDSTLLRV